MKKIAIKILLYPLPLFMVIFSYAYYEISHVLPYTTNSVSFNAKAKFILSHQTLLNKSKIIVIGSSMSLNNLYCSLFRDTFNIPVINLSSWGMKMSDYDNFDIWKKDKIVLTSMSFTDFGKSEIEKKYGYPFSGKLLQSFNFLREYKSYMSILHDYKKDTDSREYESLKFDSTGSAILSDSNFRIDNRRWNKIDSDLSDEKLTMLLNTVQNSSGKVKKMIICFSPDRSTVYSVNKSVQVKKLESAFKMNCPNVIFLNYYDMRIPDNEFVDNCHLNSDGAKRYTQKIINDLKLKYGFTKLLDK